MASLTAMLTKIASAKRVDGKGVRITRGFPRLVSAYDAIAVLRNKSSSAAGEIFRKMRDAATGEDKVWFDNIAVIKLNEKYARETYFLDGEQLIELIFKLNGNEPLLQECRRVCTNIVVRVLGGDRSLAREIEQINKKFESGEIAENDPAHIFRDIVVRDQGPQAIENGNPNTNPPVVDSYAERARILNQRENELRVYKMNQLRIREEQKAEMNRMREEMEAQIRRRREEEETRIQNMLEWGKSGSYANL